MLHCTMARLDDEYQDLEEVIVRYSISDSAMMCLKPGDFANITVVDRIRSLIVVVLRRCIVVVKLLLTKALL